MTASSSADSDFPSAPPRGEEADVRGDGKSSSDADPIDWAYARSLATGPMQDLMHHYFRAQILGAEKLPDTGPCIVAPNHSGNAFPHDAIVLDALLWERDGFTTESKFRSVFTPQLSTNWWMRPFGIDDWWRRAGGVDMTFENFDRLLERGDRVIYYPEGVDGIGKGFRQRYQLQPFHSSFVVLAVKHDVPVYPVSIVNAEWVNPLSLTFEPTDRLAQRLLGVPFMPLPIAPLALLFPFVFYLAFPCRMTFEVQEPVDIQALLREEGWAGEGVPDRSLARRVAERVRQQTQKDLDAAVERHGDRPYDWTGLVQALREIKGRRVRATPLGWPLSFLKHERDRQREPASSWVQAVLRDLDLAAWYLPLGWVLIALLRMVRRPPYGHRGLSEEERRRKAGSYRWSLEEDPLPPRDKEEL